MTDNPHAPPASQSEALVEKLRLIAVWHTPGAKTPTQPMPDVAKVCQMAANALSVSRNCGDISDASPSDEALVTQADREAVKRHQQRFLAEGTSETKLLLEAFASHRLAALRAVWTPVDVVGLGARMATLTDSNALPTTIQLIVDMYDALERLSHERASARAEGRREGIEEAAKAYEAEADTWNELGPRKSAAKRQGAKAIRARLEEQSND